jgi:hypothetical protein
MDGIAGDDNGRRVVASGDTSATTSRPSPDDLRGLLHADVERWRSTGSPPGAWLAQAFVLRVGSAWRGSPLSRRRQPMTPKQCFSNAAHIVASGRGRLKYCEGYVLTHDVGLPIHHAWALDTAADAVVDPTLAEPGLAAYVGILIEPAERAKWLVKGSSSVIMAPYVLNLEYMMFREPGLVEFPEVAEYVKSRGRG